MKQYLVMVLCVTSTYCFSETLQQIRDSIKATGQLFFFLGVLLGGKISNEVLMSNKPENH